MKRDYWQGSPFFFGGGNDVWWAEGITDVADYFGMKTLGQLRTVSYQKIQMHIFHVQVLDGMQKIINVKKAIYKMQLTSG